MGSVQEVLQPLPLQPPEHATGKATRQPKLASPRTQSAAAPSASGPASQPRLPSPRTGASSAGRPTPAPAPTYSALPQPTSTTYSSSYRRQQALGKLKALRGREGEGVGSGTEQLRGSIEQVRVREAVGGTGQVVERGEEQQPGSRPRSKSVTTTSRPAAAVVVPHTLTSSRGGSGGGDGEGGGGRAASVSILSRAAALVAPQRARP